MKPYINTDAFLAYDAGLAGLPAPVAAARKGLARVEAAAVAVSAGSVMNPHDRGEEIAQNLAAAALERDVVIDVAELAVIRAEHATREDAVKVGQRMIEVAANHLLQMLVAHRDSLIEDHLAPVVASIVAESKKCVATYSKHGTTAAEMLRVKVPAARDAWVRLDELAPMYDCVRSTRSALIPGTLQRVDRENVFGEVRDAEAHWPRVLAAARLDQNDRAPWHVSSTREKLQVFVSLGCDVWCPSPRQQDAQYMVVFGERIEQQKRNRQAMSGYREMYG